VFTHTLGVIMSIPEEQVELETDDTEQDDGNQESTDFDSINPDDLPEALKPIYNNMMADYTRSKQELSERESQIALLTQDSETLEYLLANKDIRRIAAEMSGDQPAVEQPRVIDPATDPAGYLAQVVEDAVDKKVSKQMEDLKSALMPLLSDRNQQMAQTEWQGVITKFPAAQNINVDRVNRILADNPKLSMEQAAILVDPSIVSKTARTPSAKPHPKIEVSTRKGATATETDTALSRSQQLRKAYEEQPKGTTMGSIIKSALLRLGGGK
jgi:hypothetical protein